MSEFKEGDQVYINDAYVNKDNIGAQVILVARVPRGEVVTVASQEFEDQRGECWVVNRVNGGTLTRTFFDDTTIQSPIALVAEAHISKERRSSPIRRRTKSA